MNADFNIKIGDLGLIKPLISCNSSNDKISGDSIQISSRKVSADIMSVSSY